MRCLNAQTYGIVIGLFSSNSPIMNPDITFDKIEPAKTAAPANCGYKTEYLVA